MRSAFLAAVPYVALWAGCAFTIPDGRIACDTTEDCPAGLVCVVDRCFHPDGLDAALDARDAPLADARPDARGDAGPLDAPTDAPAPFCGDGVRNGTEDCEGTDVGSATCASLGMGFASGTLGCDASCRYLTTGCSRCGNGSVDAPEDCDGDVGSESCTSIGMGFIGGTLTCDATCAYDTSGCTRPPNCGNGRIDSGEDCDGTMLGSATCSSATSGALTEGTLGCAPGCAFDTRGCNECGNGLREGAEACDGTPPAGSSCSTATGGLRTMGVLRCDATCAFDTTACTQCGNDVREGPEVCDGTDLGGRTCTAEGLLGSPLGCLMGCTGFDRSLCTGPPPPTPRRPMNDAYVGSIFVADSLRPTFTWEPGTFAGTAPVRYELELSQSSTFATTEVASGPLASATFRPAAALDVSMTAPVGARYYWRVRACAAGVCSAWSRTSWVNLGRSDRDFNGDGYADLAVGAPNDDAPAVDSGRAHVYFGGPAMDATADWTASMSQALANFGRSAGFVDLNADGFADLAVGAPGFDSGGMSNVGRVTVWFGSVTPDATADGIVTGTTAGAELGNGAEGAGDLDRDGYDDLLVGGIATAVALRGGTGATLDTTPDATFDNGGAGGLFGSRVSGGGDLDGDGFSDFAISAWQEAGEGAAYVYYGGSLPLTTTPARTFRGAPGGDMDNLGFSLACEGDVNGDGFADLVVRRRADGGLRLRDGVPRRTDPAHRPQRRRSGRGRGLQRSPVRVRRHER